MSTESLPLNYDDLDQALSALDRLPEVSEVHGHLLGCIAAGPLGEAEWLGRLSDEVQTGSLPESVQVILAELYRQTSGQLAHQRSSLDGLGLQILLPEDDVELAERVAALAQWCQGFLAGYGLSRSHLGNRAGASAELDEVLRDFAAISQASLDEEDGESNERDLFELTEYVRLAATQLCWDTRTQLGDQEQSGGGAADIPTQPEPAGLDQLFRRGPLH